MALPEQAQGLEPVLVPELFPQALALGPVPGQAPLALALEQEQEQGPVPALQADRKSVV